MTPLVRRLLILWVSLWLLSFILDLFDVPLASWLALSPRGIFGLEWSALPGVVSYALVHEPHSILHVLFNGWILAFAGPEVERLWPGRQFVRLFAICVLVGAAVHLGLAAVLPGSFAVPVIGGSGFVLACLAAMTAKYPQLRLHFFFIEMRLIVLFLALVCLDLLRMLAFLAGKGGPVAADVHLAGAAVGWLWAGSTVGSSWLGRWRQQRAIRRRQRAVNRAASDEKELNRILDKISDQGLPSLTKAERRFLEKRSQQMRSGKDRLR